MTQVVLFGAGASKGGGDVLPGPPPLGAELYPALCRACPNSWGALPRDLDAEFHEDFETAMGRLWRDASPHVPTLMQHMALFFNEFVPGPMGTHYGTLVDALQSAGRLSSTLLSTLNYENLL